MFLDWLLKMEEGNRTKDVRPGQIKVESMKMETCHVGRILHRVEERDRSTIISIQSSMIPSFIRNNVQSALCRECRIRGAGGSRQVVSYWQSSEFLSCA